MAFINNVILGEKFQFGNSRLFVHFLKGMLPLLKFPRFSSKGILPLLDSPRRFYQRDFTPLQSPRRALPFEPALRSARQIFAILVALILVLHRALITRWGNFAVVVNQCRLEIQKNQSMVLLRGKVV